MMKTVRWIITMVVVKKGRGKMVVGCSNPICHNKIELYKSRYRKNLYKLFTCSDDCKNSKTFKEHWNGILIEKRGFPNGFRNQNDYECYLGRMNKFCSCGKKLGSKNALKCYGHKFCSPKCAQKNIEVRQKQKETIRDVYGVENISQSEEIKDKKKQTCLENHGVENPAQSKTIKEKIRKSYDETFRQKIGKEAHSKLNNEKWLSDKYKTSSYHDISEELGVSIKHIGDVLRKFNIISEDDFLMSTPENSLFCFMKDELNMDNILKNKRKIISPLELDIFLPDYNLAIEFDGIYWHSEQNGKDRNYHLNKTKMCNEKGIQLLHIFENEWNDKQDIWKSIIRNKIGKNENKIFARKCEAKEVDSKTANLFLDVNHLQSRDRSSIRLGLYYEDELVSLFTVGKSRYNKKYQYELLRFCNKLNTSIVGSFGKLLKYFEKTYNPESLITYADMRYSNGNLYELFFNYSHDSKPNYFYKVGNKLASRLAYQKHKLADRLELFDELLSEYQNMLLNGYDRIWDCGNKVYVKKYQRRI